MYGEEKQGGKPELSPPSHLKKTGSLLVAICHITLMSQPEI
jgi:hypothetical protein